MASIVGFILKGGSMKNLRMRSAALGVAAVAGLVTLVGGAPSALAAGGTIRGTGGCLNVRTGPGTGYPGTGACLPDGTSVSVVCQTSGDAVNGNWGTTTIWDKLDGYNGYASDGYVYTGSN